MEGVGDGDGDGRRDGCAEGRRLSEVSMGMERSPSMIGRYCMYSLPSREWCVVNEKSAKIGACSSDKYSQLYKGRKKMTRFLVGEIDR